MYMQYSQLTLVLSCLNQITKTENITRTIRNTADK
jgi:hypothetical protein